MLNKIAAIQNLLNPPKPSDNAGKSQVSHSKRNKSNSGVRKFVIKFVAWLFLSSILASIPVLSLGPSVPAAEQEKWLDSYMPFIMIGSWIVAAIILNIGKILSLLSTSKQEMKENDRSYYKHGLSLMRKGLFDEAKAEFMKVIQNSTQESRWYSSAQTRLMEMKMQGQ